jgi:hypothetical protein
MRETVVMTLLSLFLSIARIESHVKLSLDVEMNFGPGGDTPNKDIASARKCFAIACVPFVQRKGSQPRGKRLTRR